MAGHLHCYGCELALLTETAQDLKQYHAIFHQKFVDRGIRIAGAFEYTFGGFEQIKPQFSGITGFKDEPQLEIDNILVLVDYPVLKKLVDKIHQNHTLSASREQASHRR